MRWIFLIYDSPNSFCNKYFDERGLTVLMASKCHLPCTWLEGLLDGLAGLIFDSTSLLPFRLMFRASILSDGLGSVGDVLFDGGLSCLCFI